MYSFNNVHTFTNTRHTSLLEHPVDKHSQKQFTSGLIDYPCHHPSIKMVTLDSWQCGTGKIHAPNALQGGNDRLQIFNLGSKSLAHP